MKLFTCSKQVFVLLLSNTHPLACLFLYFDI